MLETYIKYPDIYHAGIDYLNSENSATENNSNSVKNEKKQESASEAKKKIENTAKGNSDTGTGEPPPGSDQGSATVPAEEQAIEYNSGALLRTLVPGQIAWDNARTNFAQGKYVEATAHTGAMVAEQVMTVMGVRAIQQGSRAIAQGVNEALNAVRSVRVLYHGTHSAHHPFAIIGKQPHLQWTIYRHGVKGSHLNIRIPVPWGR
jgi:hypothetical protein